MVHKNRSWWFLEHEIRNKILNCLQPILKQYLFSFIIVYLIFSYDAFSIILFTFLPSVINHEVPEIWNFKGFMVHKNQCISMSPLLQRYSIEKSQDFFNKVFLIMFICRDSFSTIFNFKCKLIWQSLIRFFFSEWRERVTFLGPPQIAFAN